MGNIRLKPTLLFVLFFGVVATACTKEKNDTILYGYSNIKWRWSPETTVYELKEEGFDAVYPEEEMGIRLKIARAYLAFLKNIFGKYTNFSSAFFETASPFNNTLLSSVKELAAIQTQYKRIVNRLPGCQDRFWKRAINLHHVYAVKKDGDYNLINNAMFFYSPGTYGNNDKMLLAYALHVDKSQRNKISQAIVQKYGDPKTITFNKHSPTKSFSLFKWHQNGQVLVSLININYQIWYINYDSISRYLSGLDLRANNLLKESLKTKLHQEKSLEEKKKSLLDNF